jgi:hypothetical protein
MFSDRRNRTCEHEIGTELGVEQRFDTAAIANEPDVSRVSVGNREGKHSAKFVDARGSPGRPGFDQRFGVTARFQTDSQPRQVAADLIVVVDFPVENDHEPAILGDPGLLAAVDIANGKSSMRQCDGSFTKQPRVIRTALNHRVAHRDDLSISKT